MRCSLFENNVGRRPLSHRYIGGLRQEQRFLGPGVSGRQGQQQGPHRQRASSSAPLLMHVAGPVAAISIDGHAAKVSGPAAHGRIVIPSADDGQSGWSPGLRRSPLDGAVGQGLAQLGHSAIGEFRARELQYLEPPQPTEIRNGGVTDLPPRQVQFSEVAKGEQHR
jgi:hypothetical protein